MFFFPAPSGGCQWPRPVLGCVCQFPRWDRPSWYFTELIPVDYSCRRWTITCICAHLHGKKTQVNLYQQQTLANISKILTPTQFVLLTVYILGHKMIPESHNFQTTICLFQLCPVRWGLLPAAKLAGEGLSWRKMHQNERRWIVAVTAAL